MSDEERINHPPHYTGHPSGVECIQIVEHMTFCAGNAVKYLWRAGLKDSAPLLDDLKKARWYVDREIARVQAQQDVREAPNGAQKNGHARVRDVRRFDDIDWHDEDVRLVEFTKTLLAQMEDGRSSIQFEAPPDLDEHFREACLDTAIKLGWAASWHPVGAGTLATVEKDAMPDHYKMRLDRRI